MAAREFPKMGAVEVFRLKLLTDRFTLHNVQFVKYDVTVSFMAQVLDTVT